MTKPFEFRNPIDPRGFRGVVTDADGNQVTSFPDGAVLRLDSVEATDYEWSLSLSLSDSDGMRYLITIEMPARTRVSQAREDE